MNQRTSIPHQEIDAFKQDLVVELSHVTPHTQPERLTILSLTQCWTDVANIAFMRGQNLTYEKLHEQLDADRKQSRDRAKHYSTQPDKAAARDELIALDELYQILEVRLRNCYSRHAHLENEQTPRSQSI